MKRKLLILCALFVMVAALPFLLKTEVSAIKEYRAEDLQIGSVLESFDDVTASEKLKVLYYLGLHEPREQRSTVRNAGESINIDPWKTDHPDTDIYGWVVLDNSVTDGVRVLKLYPVDGDGVGGVRVSNLRGNEAVASESWLDFSGTKAKTKTVRYFKKGDSEPFYTETTELRYLHMGNRLDVSPRGGISYPVAYWRVKSEPGASGTLDLVAGVDVGTAEFVKTNEMYIGKIIPAGTLIDYAPTPYVSLHYYSSEGAYSYGKASKSFSYSERKEYEEQWTVIGAGMDAPAFMVKSYNDAHIHFAAVDSAFSIPDRTTVHSRDLLDGDVLYNGDVLTFDTSYPCKIKYFTRDREPIEEITTSDPKGVAIASPEGANAESWVVFYREEESVSLFALPFKANGVVVPADANRSLRYGGALTEISGRDYYYYDTFSVAIADARANTVSRTEILKDPDAMAGNTTCDKVLLVRDVDNIGTFGKNGVGKGIVIDLNGHNASRVSAGTIPEKETLVLTNSRAQKSYLTGGDAFDDESGEGSCTGAVVMNNLNVSTKIYPAMHTLYFMKGTYYLNSATVMEKHLENAVYRDKEGCPLYKYYADYPYWTCRIEPEDASAKYPNGRKVILNDQTFYYYVDENVAKAEAGANDTVILCDGVNPRTEDTDPEAGSLGESLGEKTTDTENTPDTEKKESNAAKILIPAAGVLAVLLIALVLILRNKKKKENEA